MKSTVAGDRLTRFSDRVEDYIKYRPGYPKQVADLLLGSLDETSDLAVVDLGSGTGKLTQRFLERKLRTFAVEPNPEMREAAEALFAGDRLFMSVDATAEDTGLEDGIADLIVIGQALHWFDLGKVRDECCRLLKKDAKAKVAVVYNERKVLSPMLADYETFLHTHARSYQTVGHRNVDGSVFHSFFGPAGYEVHVFQFSRVSTSQGWSVGTVPLRTRSRKETRRLRPPRRPCIPFSGSMRRVVGFPSTTKPASIWVPWFRVRGRIALG